jgi:hypothetical protein
LICHCPSPLPSVGSEYLKIIPQFGIAILIYKILDERRGHGGLNGSAGRVRSSK